MAHGQPRVQLWLLRWAFNAEAAQGQGDRYRDRRRERSGHRCEGPMPLPRTAVIVPCACLAVVLGGCSSPNTPSVSVVASRPTSPSNGSAFSYYSQPVTLVMASGVATGGTLTSTVEVATDAAFTTIITTQTVSPDATGRLTISLDHLSSATTYYWRVKTSAGDNPGTVSAPQSFSIGPLLVFQPPTPMQPLADTFPHTRPTFVVTNAARTGPPATVTYRFDVARDAAFATVVATGTTPEVPTQTSFTPNIDLTSGTTYFWRAQASDTTKGVTGPYSSAQAFSTVSPEDGSFRYTLAIHAPPYCLTHNTHDDSCSVGTKSWDLSDYSFDGTLTVTTDNLQFSSALPYAGKPLTLGFRRLNNRLSGAISGMHDYPLPNPGPLINAVSFNGVVVGDTDNAGHFHGTFDGMAGLIREGFPCYHNLACSTSGFTWTLTPH